MTTADEDNVVRDRVSRLFQYVRAINQLRNPIQRHIRELDWTLRLVISRRIPVSPEGSAPPPTPGAAADDPPASDALLRVERPTLKPIPPPPREISDWVEDGWQTFAQPAQSRSSRRVDGPDGPTIQAFEDDPTRVRIFDEWRESRRLFIEAEQPAVDAFAVFERSIGYAASSNAMQNDSRLFWVTACCVGRSPGGSIRFPVVLQRLELEFDPTVPAFTLNDAESSTEFNSALLRSIDSVDGAIVGAITSELAEGQYHPLMAERSRHFSRVFPRDSQPMAGLRMPCSRANLPIRSCIAHRSYSCENDVWICHGPREHHPRSSARREIAQSLQTLLVSAASHRSMSPQTRRLPAYRAMKRLKTCFLRWKPTKNSSVLLRRWPGTNVSLSRAPRVPAKPIRLQISPGIFSHREKVFSLRAVRPKRYACFAKKSSPSSNRFVSACWKATHVATTN